MRTATWLMNQADAFFGSDQTRPVARPDSFRFCTSCGAMRPDHELFSWSLNPSAKSFLTDAQTFTCHGCGQGADGRRGRLQAAGISQVFCGWCDDGTSAEALRSWKSMPGNEANCLAAGRLLGEMLLWRCDDDILMKSDFSQGNVLVPVPGWWERRLRRGFDAPHRLAEGISEILGWPEGSVKRHPADCFVCDLMRGATLQGGVICGWWTICWQAVPRVLRPAGCFAAFAHIPSFW